MQAFCGGIAKTASGDFGTGPTIDATVRVCLETSGCSVVAGPAGGVASIIPDLVSTLLGSATSIIIASNVILPVSSVATSVKYFLAKP